MAELQIVIRVLEAYGLAKSDLLTNSDPLVVAKFAGLRLKSARTTAIKNTNNPVWNQELTLYPKRADDILLLKVYDKDIGKNDLLGYAEIPLNSYFGGGFQDLWLQLVKKKGGIRKQWTSVPGHLHVQIFCGTAAECIGLPPANYCDQSFQNSVTPSFQNQKYTETTLTSAHQPVYSRAITTSLPGNSGYQTQTTVIGDANPVLIGKQTTTVVNPGNNFTEAQTSYAPQLNKSFTTTQTTTTPAVIYPGSASVANYPGSSLTNLGHIVTEKTVTTTTTTNNQY